MWDRRDFCFQTESPVTRRICMHFYEASKCKQQYWFTRFLSVESCVKGSSTLVSCGDSFQDLQTWSLRLCVDCIPVQLRWKGKREVLPQTVPQIWVRFVVVWGGIYVTREFPRRKLTQHILPVHLRSGWLQLLELEGNIMSSMRWSIESSTVPRQLKLQIQHLQICVELFIDCNLLCPFEVRRQLLSGHPTFEWYMDNFGSSSK